MCGITGFWQPSLLTGGAPAMDAMVQNMMAAIAHRGPDSQGHWSDPETGLALGHLRLAIVDLSPAGHQPMVSHSGRFVLVYNGEIYNHHDLRTELAAQGQAPQWRGTSDTETLLAGIDAWGLEPTLRRSVGMFALALWDRQDRVLHLARDRMGEKPLYFGWQGAGEGRSFLFGSELKALRCHPAFEGRVKRSGVLEVLRHGNVGEDRAIYEGLAKVRPGQIVTISDSKRDHIGTSFYWNAAVVSAAPKPAAPSDTEAVDGLEAVLERAVSEQMMADVPLGAFLSGGIDSSTVVALMQKLSSRPVHTFSIGFNEARYNEAEHARAVAKHLGTDHTDLYVSGADLLAVVPRLPIIYDEPHADSSQIPTFLVSELARRHVTVSLSGDGGDELFGGYGRYGHAAKLRQKLASAPLAARRAVARGVRGLPAAALTRALSPLVPTPVGKEPIGQRAHRLANYARQGTLEELHRTMVSVWRFPETAVPGAEDVGGLLSDALPPRGALGDIERLMQLDMMTYMVDDILAKVDRATMAVALESRAPLLDHRVAEYAWSLPEDMKWRGDTGKWVLRQVLFRYVPKAMVERPKMGFEVPIGPWLRGPLKDWAAALIDPQRLRSEGIFDATVIDTVWTQHQSGQFNWGAQLWCVLMVQAWLESTGHTA
ncbi:MAG: asparagine synthase (glutamine-hydrolyzing) [Pseudomonadota bacterium]